MMKPAQTISPAKEKLLDAAQRLMLAKGFVATTVDEICDEAGLTKGSFFHYFESKDHLGEAVLNRFVGARAEMFREARFHQKSDPLQRIYGLLDFISAMSKSQEAPSGCLLGNFSQELSQTHPKIRAQCANHFARWTEEVKRDLDEAKSKYAPHSSIHTGSLAEHFIAVLQGALILAKAKQDKTTVKQHVRHFKQYVKSIFER